VLNRRQVLEGLQVGVAPQCQESGDFQAVQCDTTRGQCWCVDQQGMELYGTRQNGRPARCEAKSTTTNNNDVIYNTTITISITAKPA